MSHHEGGPRTLGTQALERSVLFGGRRLLINALSERIVVRFENCNWIYPSLKLVNELVVTGEDQVQKLVVDLQS